MKFDMVASSSLLSILVVLFGVVAVSAINPTGTRHFIEEIRKRNKATYDNAAADPFSKFFTQRLDHFDRSNNVTFSQRYFVNTTFWDGSPDSPVFLCVGGEGTPLDYTVLTNSVHCSDMTELAPKHNALMLALEHRYYGPSNPFSDYSTEHLKWLNSEQAAGDIASFYDVMSDTYKLQTTNKWVTWGGSYPGMMAAIARLRYPNLIHATISSSAPLRAEVDMVGYNNVVADSLAAASAGGSDACVNTVIEGHQTIGTMLQTSEGRRSLETLFNICTPGSLDNLDNQKSFAGDGVVYIPAQSNDPACTSKYCNIASICQLMIDPLAGTSLDKLVTLSKAQQGSSCVNVNYQSELNVYSNPNLSDRTWLYQTCTEWGFYQTCEVGTKCPYTQGLHTLSYDYQLCQVAFGVSPADVDYQVNYANTMYGGANIQSSRTFFVNGEIDPWHANSVLVSPNAQEPTLWVVGSSHHFWTHPSKSTDSKEIVAARQAIWNQVGEWLKV